MQISKQFDNCIFFYIYNANFQQIKELLLLFNSKSLQINPFLLNIFLIMVIVQAYHNDINKIDLWN